MRAKKVAYNVIVNIFYEIILVVSGLILPRLILSYFGSSYNGVTSSITQFIGYTSLLAAGVGGATQAALYKPLAERDTLKISGIIRATEIFMRKVAFVFISTLVIIAATYPLLISDEFEWFFVFSLVIILGAGTFVQYFFGISYRILINADQRNYIFVLVQICTTVLNTAVAAFLITRGYDIRIVKLASSIVFAMNPIFIHIYVRKRYKISHKVQPDNSAIKQRWDAFAHQVANFVYSNVNIIIVTIFLGIVEVSVYVVYSMIINNVKKIISTLEGASAEAPLGNMLAQNETESVDKSMRLYEFINNSLSAIFYTCTAVLIVPFVSVYTKGIYDVSYYRPIFAYIFCAGELLSTIRVPYQALTQAAGHYKQTRNGAIIEVGINIVVSMLLVQWLGLVGVVIGRFCAMMFRTVLYSIYVSRNILIRSISVFLRKMLITLINMGVIFIIIQFFPDMYEASYMAWIISAVPVFLTAVIVTALFSVLFYREEISYGVQVAKSIVAKKKRG